jgi:LacI family transcriptional regulator
MIACMPKGPSARKATAQDIARRSGFSVPAVYQALSGAGKLSDKTRRRILRTAEELGYAPNAAAKAVSRGRFGGIAILSSIERGRPVLSSRLLHGVQDECRLRNLHLSIATVLDKQLTEDRQLPKLLRELSVDGFLIDIITNIPPRLVELIDRHRVPVIWLNVQQPVDCLYIDDEQGLYAGTQYLLRLGHRRIAYTITAGHIGDRVHYSVAAREAGYVRAMAEAGLAPRLLKSETELSPAQRMQFIKQWLKAADRPTAVIAYERTDALPILWKAMQLGLRVPSDLSVLHVTEEPDAWTGLTLSRLRIPQYNVGHRAVDLLERRINKPAEPIAPVAVALEFIEGETTAPPSGRSGTT